MLIALQRATPWRWVIAVSRGLSVIAEHSIAWIALSGLLALLDVDRRLLWISVLVAAVIAHVGATAVKVLVRRPRPSDPRVQLLGSTLSRLSFPSSHSAGTSAFAVGAAMIIPPLTWAAVPLIALMGFARLRLGVHYPSDVIAGVALGAVCAAICQWLAATF